MFSIFQEKFKDDIELSKAKIDITEKISDLSKEINRMEDEVGSKKYSKEILERKLIKLSETPERYLEPKIMIG